MSYTYEPQPITGEPELVISGFENGIGDSPFTGHELILGVNVRNFETVGYSNYARALSVQPAGTTVAQVNYTVQDPSYLTNLYSLDVTGRVYYSTNSGKNWDIVASQPSYSGDSARGNGLVILPGYVSNSSWLIVAANTWYALVIEWRSSPSHQVRFSFDGTNFTDWQTPFADWTSGINNCEFNTSTYGGDTLTAYWDYLAENPLNSNMFLLF